MIEQRIALIRIERTNFSLALSLFRIVVAVHFQIDARAVAGESDEPRRREVRIDPRPESLDHDQVWGLLSQSGKTRLDFGQASLDFDVAADFDAAEVARSTRQGYVECSSTVQRILDFLKQAAEAVRNKQPKQ
jgi:hypothetical protein